MSGPRFWTPATSPSVTKPSASLPLRGRTGGGYGPCGPSSGSVTSARSSICCLGKPQRALYLFLTFANHYSSPITWPVAIIPVIPNFPLFYVLWRAWSHYKAWRGATYLEAVLKAGMITEKESSTLDNIYAHHRADVKDGKIIKEGGDGADFYPGMMITTAEVPDLKKAFDLRPAEVVDVERAIEQASHRARDGAKVLQLKAEGKSEKAELKFKKEE